MWLLLHVGFSSNWHYLYLVYCYFFRFYVRISTKQILPWTYRVSFHVGNLRWIRNFEPNVFLYSLGDSSFSTYAKLSKNPIFLTCWFDKCQFFWRFCVRAIWPTPSWQIFIPIFRYAITLWCLVVTKSSHILNQTSSFQLQVCLSKWPFCYYQVLKTDIWIVLFWRMPNALRFTEN